MNLLIAELGKNTVDKLTETQSDFQRILISTVVLSIKKAGKQLMPVVKRHPTAVEIKSGGAYEKKKRWYNYEVKEEW